MKQRAFSRMEWMGLVAGVITTVVMVAGCPSTTPPVTDPDPGQTTPSDADGDGVADADDLCANTPPRTVVDATGCPRTTPPGNDPGANQPAPDADADGDGVPNADDLCTNTPSGTEVDGTGCPTNDGGTTNPDCGNGTVEGVETCDTGGESATCDGDCTAVVCGDGRINRTAGEACDPPAAGSCSDSCQLITNGGGGGGGGGGGSTDPVCGNGTVEGTETCDTGGESATCDGDCTTVECGDGTINTAAGEACEPPNTDTCNATCQVVSAGSFNADACENASVLTGEGAFTFDTTSATQDGPGHRECVNAGEDNFDGDVWACWTAPCTSTVFVQTCGLTTVDTKLAVYTGCDCPVSDATLLSCNDDRCDVQSIATFEAQAGQQYLVRVGSFPGTSLGTGAVSISCGLNTCTPTAGDCTAANGSAGCSDVSCCESVCAIDPFCCDTNWDNVCVDEAAGICSGSFSACARGAGACTDGTATNGTPGCSDIDCCNTICASDPFCCLTEWDSVCAEQEAQFCHSTCGPGAGDCFAAGGNGSPGCEKTDCCAEVCVRDPLCCSSAWDAVCAEAAALLCTP